VIISPAGIGSGEAFGSAAVSTGGALIIQPAGIGSAEAFGTAVVTAVLLFVPSIQLFRAPVARRIYEVPFKIRIYEVKD
jgi:hypothetical protein